MAVRGPRPDYPGPGRVRLCQRRTREILGEPLIAGQPIAEPHERWPATVHELGELGFTPRVHGTSAPNGPRTPRMIVPTEDGTVSQPAGRIRARTADSRGPRDRSAGNHPSSHCFVPDLLPLAATGIATPSHAPGDTIGAQRRECQIAVLGIHSEWGGDEQRYWPVFGQPHRGADAGKQVLRPHAGIPVCGAGEHLTGWPAI